MLDAGVVGGAQQQQQVFFLTPAAAAAAPNNVREHLHKLKAAQCVLSFLNFVATQRPNLLADFVVGPFHLPDDLTANGRRVRPPQCSDDTLFYFLQVQLLVNEMHRLNNAFSKTTLNIDTIDKELNTLGGFSHCKCVPSLVALRKITDGSVRSFFITKAALEQTVAVACELLPNWLDAEFPRSTGSHRNQLSYNAPGEYYCDERVAARVPELSYLWDPRDADFSRPRHAHGWIVHRPRHAPPPQNQRCTITVEAGKQPQLPDDYFPRISRPAGPKSTFAPTVHIDIEQP